MSEIDRPRTPRAGRRAALGAAVALGLTGAFVTGTVVARPADTPDRTRPSLTRDLVPPPAPVAFHGALQGPDSCEALRTHYVDEALTLVGPRGWQTPGTRYPEGRVFAPGAAVAEDASPTAGTTASTTRATSSGTGTTVQEAGVDEPDVVKTDGSLLVRVRGDELVTADVSGATVDELATLDLGDLRSPELLLAGDTVVVLGALGQEGLAADTRVTRVVGVDVTDPTTPTVSTTVDYDTGLVSVRQHGDTVRVVLDAGLPRLDFVRPDASLGVESARAANEQLVRESTVEDWLPARRVDAAEEEGFLDCGDVALPEADLGLDTTTVVGFDAADPAATESIALAGRTPLTYESADHLYLATGGPAVFGGPICLELCTTPFGAPTVSDGAADGTTHVYDFALRGVRATYVGAGEVDGRLSDRWSLDEHDGVLRLALEPTSETTEATSVVTMRAQGSGADAELVEVGRLDGLGRREQLQSVRWFDDLAVLVTFRQVDPLHAVDLTDVTRPEELGRLEVPGFSDYLHPLGSMRMIGIGQGLVGARGRWGAQAGLFDVTDLRDVRRLDVVGYAPGSRAGASTDPRQLTWLPARRTVLTVVVRGYRSPVASVSVLRVAKGQLSNEMVPVDRGRGVDDVRLVPLPDDRVVLVTDDGARFLDL